jgi:hypothetical protein
LGGAAFAVSVGVAWLDPTSFEQHVWFSFVGAVAAESGRQTNQWPSRISSR